MSEAKETKGYYSDSQKRAIYSYRARNKEAYNKYQRERHNWRLENEDGYREMKEEQTNKRNAKNKAKREAEQEAKVYIELLEKPQLENIIINVNSDN